jgi:hypothetical protein
MTDDYSIDDAAAVTIGRAAEDFETYGHARGAHCINYETNPKGKWGGHLSSATWSLRGVFSPGRMNPNSGDYKLAAKLSMLFGAGCSFISV